MNRTPFRCTLPLAILVVAGLASLAPAGPVTAAVAPEELAAATTYAGGVDFRPNVDFSRATLTVSGNGQTFQQSFAPGDRISIGMFDPEGQPLADGVYSWELELTPDAATALELRRAASLAGGRPAGAWSALTGTFAIRGGNVAGPEIIEAAPRGADPAQSGLRSAFPASSFSQDRGGAEDDDAAVGSRADAAAQINAAASRRAPAAQAGVLVQPDRLADDSDAITAALGGSLEQAAANDVSVQSRRAPAPRPRSDGSNGRPRSQ